MPRDPQAFTTSRTEEMPARCPNTRGKCRCLAQRPFPSMMIAMCFGSLERLICFRRTCSVVGAERIVRRAAIQVPSDFHNVAFFSGQHIVHLFGVVVGQL